MTVHEVYACHEKNHASGWRRFARCDTAGRRRFLAGSLVAGLAGASCTTSAQARDDTPHVARRFRLGTVTYNVAADWDLETLITRCEALGLAAVELRTTHKHGVEPSMSPADRNRVRRRFERTPVKLFGLGTTCEFHSPRAQEVRRNIDLTRRFLELARDVGATGVKVRPNGLATNHAIPVETSLKQIGTALAECGRSAESYGIEIWVEVHGPGTALPANMRAIMEHCAHPRVGITWNSNPTDVADGSVRAAFEMLAPFIRCVHIHDLWDYPYGELFSLLRRAGYERYTMIEMAGSPDVERLLRYYCRLWDALSR
jgi:sugar phosphate isomerase/epimerase